MKIGKAAGDNGLTLALLEGGDIVLENLAVRFLDCLKTQKVLIAGKNSSIILIHKKRNPKDPKNYRTISLVLVVYKLFTKL